MADDLIVDNVERLSAEQRAVVEEDDQRMLRPMDVPPKPHRSLPTPPQEDTR